MGKSSKARATLPPSYIFFLVLGGMLGAAWVLRMEEEDRERLKKNLRELGELPFRIFI